MMTGTRDVLSFEDMRPEERMIIKTLEQAHASGQSAMRIAELQMANGWDEVDEHDCPDSQCAICATALRLGNSKVRNNLRRLMRYGWIHRPVDGTYALLTEHKAEPVVEPVVVVEVAPTPAPPLVVIRKKDRHPNPHELTEDEHHAIRARLMRGEVNQVAEVKHLDCSFYNTCLDQAISGSWAGFSCKGCTAYTAPDRHQAEQDVLACLALNRAHELLEKHGKVMRVRGVKPGADAKRTTVEDELDYAI